MPSGPAAWALTVKAPASYQGMPSGIPQIPGVRKYRGTPQLLLGGARFSAVEKPNLLPERQGQRFSRATQSNNEAGSSPEVFPPRYTARMMEAAEMLADVKAYDAAKARLDNGEDELIPLEITERRLKGEPALRVWREHRKLTQEQLAKKARVSRALIAAIETKRKAGSVSTWKKLGAALDVG